MPIYTNERNYPYPAKNESFDSSWGTFQKFFNQLDREFSSFVNFLIGSRIRFLWVNENDQSEQTGMRYGDFGIRLDTGGVYEYRQFVDGTNNPGWKLKYDVNSLPLNTNRDPDPNDWGFPIGHNWVNNTTGESFYCLKNDIGKTIWVSENKAIGHDVKEAFFVPAMNYEFRGKYINGACDNFGRFFYTGEDNTVELRIGNKVAGVIILDPTKKYYSIGDLDIMQFPPDNEDFGKCNTSLFIRYITLMSKISHQSLPTFNHFKRVILTRDVIEIISTDSSLSTELTNLGIDIPTASEIKEATYDFYHYITYMQQISNDVKKDLLRCMACSGLSSYDGNEVLVDGNEILADGNELPPCA